MPMRAGGGDFFGFGGRDLAERRERGSAGPAGHTNATNVI